MRARARARAKYFLFSRAAFSGAKDLLFSRAAFGGAKDLLPYFPRQDAIPPSKTRFPPSKTRFPSSNGGVGLRPTPKTRAKARVFFPLEDGNRVLEGGSRVLEGEIASWRGK